MGRDNEDRDRSALKGDVYFSLLQRDLDFALRQGVSELCVGRNAPAFKTRLGRVQQPRYLFINGRGWVEPILWTFSEVLFPSFELMPSSHVSLHSEAPKRRSEANS